MKNIILTKVIKSQIDSLFFYNFLIQEDALPHTRLLIKMRKLTCPKIMDRILGPVSVLKNNNESRCKFR